MRCTLNRSSGYRRCAARSGEIALLGFTVPGNTFVHACSTGSLSSMAYSVTVPSYASTVALTELRMWDTCWPGASRFTATSLASAVADDNDVNCEYG